MRIKGSIYSVDLSNKLVGIRKFHKIDYFYFQNSQMNLFRRYLYQNVWIDLDYDEDKKSLKRKKEAYPVNFVYSLSKPTKNHKVVYYDKVNLNTSLSKFFQGLGNVMVIDFEMNMPNYSFKGKGFRTEIIQAGFVIIDSQGQEITRYTNYIKPTLVPSISKRTEKFLSIDSLDYDAKAITYDQFYEDFKEVIDNYNPTILVYGRNDIIVLKDSYNINGKPSLTEKTRFINLCQIIKSFYDLRNDPGLFKLYKLYYDHNDIQLHDAFTDCEVTSLVFKAFKDEVNYLTYKAEVIRRNLD